VVAPSESFAKPKIPFSWVDRRCPPHLGNAHRAIEIHPQPKHAVVQKLNTDGGGSANDIIGRRIELERELVAAPPFDSRWRVPPGLASAPVVATEEHPVDTVGQSQITRGGIERCEYAMVAGRRHLVRVWVARLAENLDSVHGLDGNRKAVKLDYDPNCGRLGNQSTC
jgi:hypothetical protein